MLLSNSARRLGWERFGRETEFSQAIEGNCHVFDFEHKTTDADELFFTKIVTPAHIVDECVYIVAQLVRQNDKVDEFGTLNVTQRVYPDVLIEQLIDSDYIPAGSTDVIEDFHLLYEELIGKFYDQLYIPLSFLLQQYGIRLMEQVRFKRNLGHGIVLEFGDEEESVSRAVGYR